MDPIHTLHWHPATENNLGGKTEFDLTHQHILVTRDCVGLTPFHCPEPQYLVVGMPTSCLDKTFLACIAPDVCQTHTHVHTPNRVCSSAVRSLRPTYRCCSTWIKQDFSKNKKETLFFFLQTVVLPLKLPSLGPSLYPGYEQDLSIWQFNILTFTQLQIGATEPLKLHNYIQQFNEFFIKYTNYLTLLYLKLFMYLQSNRVYISIMSNDL